MILTAILTPKTRLVLSGDYESLKEQEKVILISNHQIYPDWLYLWLFARKFNRHGDLQILLIWVLKYIPLFGLGMQFFNFIFMSRKLKDDRESIQRATIQQKKYYKEFPHWLLIFPEGTLNVPANRETTEKYAEKTGITQKPKVVNQLTSMSFYPKQQACFWLPMHSLMKWNMFMI